MAPSAYRWFKRAGNISILLGIVLVLVGLAQRSAALLSEIVKHSPARSAINFSKGFCDEALDTSNSKFRNQNDLEQVRIELKEGCYAWNYTLPGRWGSYQVTKSRNPGDWATMWCDGRLTPSPVYQSYEDFHGEFLNCGAFALQGKGTITFKRLTVQ